MSEIIIEDIPRGLQPDLYRVLQQMKMKIEQLEDKLKEA